jgi:hypothetical protein
MTAWRLYGGAKDVIVTLTFGPIHLSSFAFASRQRWLTTWGVVPSSNQIQTKPKPNDASNHQSKPNPKLNSAQARRGSATDAARRGTDLDLLLALLDLEVVRDSLDDMRCQS